MNGLDLETAKEFTYSLSAEWVDSAQGYMFNMPQFFPIDDRGWGNERWKHNYGFCMELHNQFTYKKGQVFEFMGDDDVWVFIDNQLAIDLGGPHPPASDSVDLDTLGLTEGNTYDFDFFYCERHVEGSSLKFTTSIVLYPCGQTDSDGDNIGDICDICQNGDPNVKLKVPPTTGSTVKVSLVLENTVQINPGLDFHLDFGDGTTQDVHTGTDTTISHTYSKPGDYKITVQSDAASGCAAGSDEVEVTITNRVAPKCAEIGLLTLLNAPSKR
jgi:fibro-slime domain-containing protein